MNPNAHAKDGEQPVHGCRVLLRYGLMDLDKETAIATSAWADMRDMYAARTAGTWE